MNEGEGEKDLRKGVREGMWQGEQRQSRRDEKGSPGRRQTGRSVLSHCLCFSLFGNSLFLSQCLCSQTPKHLKDSHKIQAEWRHLDSSISMEVNSCLVLYSYYCKIKDIADIQHKTHQHFFAPIFGWWKLIKCHFTHFENGAWIRSSRSESGNLPKAFKLRWYPENALGIGDKMCTTEK